MSTTDIINVDFKILLHSLDYSNPIVKQILFNGPDIQLIDPVDYANVNSVLHWKQMQKLPSNDIDQFKVIWADRVNAFKTLIVDLFKLGVFFKLIPKPYDITENVKTIEGFEVSLDDFDNSISIRLAQQDPTSNINGNTTYTDGHITTDKIQDFISENQIIEIQVNRNGTYYTAFVGIITTINFTTIYGQVPSIDMAIMGVNKFLATTNIVQRQAIYNQFELGAEITYSGVPVYQDNFNEKNLGQIFDVIMSEILSLVGKPMSNTLAQAASQLTVYNVDDTRFINVESFRTSFLPLYTYYLVRGQASFPDPSLYDQATIEHGEHKAYNVMVASGFQYFYSQMTTPKDILRMIRDVCYYDIFENRYGQIVCRPPKYNELEVDLPIYEPTPTTSAQPGTVLTPVTGKRVIESEKILSFSYHRNDSVLISRYDTKWILPFIDEVPFIGSWWTDANALFKYGLRVKPPASNPNATNRWLAAMHSALCLYKENAFTRQINLEVVNDQDYELGRLYYFIVDDIEYVGYLVSINTNLGYGQVSKHVLTFNYVRKVLRAASTHFKDDELDMIYTIYHNQIIPLVGFDIDQESKLSYRKDMAQKFLEKNSKKAILYFSIIPTILNLINELDDKSYKSAPVGPTRLTQDEINELIANKKKHRDLAAENSSTGYYQYFTPATLSAVSTPPPIIPIVDINNNNRIIVNPVFPEQIFALSNKQKWAEYSSGFYIDTNFPLHIFDSPLAQENSIITQNLINALTSIDLSWKYYNQNVDKAVSQSDKYWNLKLNLTNISNVASGNFVSADGNGFYSTYSETISPDTLKANNIHDYSSALTFYLPIGEFWIVSHSITTSTIKIPFNSGQINVVFFSNNNIALFDGNFKLLTQFYETDLKINDLLFVNTDGALQFDLENVLVPSKGNGVIWGFRSTTENATLAESNKIYNAADSQELHYQGKALDLGLIGFRGIESSRINISVDLMSQQGLLVTMMKAVLESLKNPQIVPPIISNYFAVLYPYNTLFSDPYTWAKKDVFFSIQADI